MKTMNDLRLALKESLEEAITTAVKGISGGQARDYAEYKYACGKAQGLSIAARSVDEVFKGLLDEGDEDE